MTSSICHQFATADLSKEVKGDNFNPVQGSLFGNTGGVRIWDLSMLQGSSLKFGDTHFRKSETINYCSRKWLLHISLHKLFVRKHPWTLLLNAPGFNRYQCLGWFGLCPIWDQFTMTVCSTLVHRQSGNIPFSINHAERAPVFHGQESFTSGFSGGQISEAFLFITHLPF